MFSIILFTFTPIILFVETDPFYFTMPKMFPFLQNYFCSISGWITFLLRVYFSFVCVTEACRFLKIYLSLLLVCWGELTIQTLALLNRIPLPQGEQIAFINLYSGLRLVHERFLPVANLYIGNLMGIGFLVSVVCNVSVIKASKMVSLYIYWLLPVVSIVVAGVIYLLLPMAVAISALSDQLFRNGLN